MPRPKKNGTSTKRPSFWSRFSDTFWDELPSAAAKQLSRDLVSGASKGVHYGLKTGWSSGWDWYQAPKVDYSKFEVHKAEGYHGTGHWNTGGYDQPTWFNGHDEIEEVFAKELENDGFTVIQPQQRWNDFSDFEPVYDNIPDIEEL